MKTLSVLFVLFSLSANAQVLGELKGQGQINASYANFDGSSTKRSSPCNVAMNIHADAKSVAVEFSVFECSKLTSWNDWPVAYSIVGDKLVDANGVQKGSVLADGSYQFTEVLESSQTYMDYHYDFDCRMSYIGKKTLTLQNKITYNLKEINGSWILHRTASEDRQAWKSRRDYDRCPAVTIPTKLGSSTDLTVTLSK
ncbi:hypothetical protein [Bdellovibrio sp. NC01]|uniref:hypothetical protein n=1 Tax=Bdellovibrio sp. NC01 TaxID=2220073 RepID=UPI001159333A|nr:hypothetical protein [Bdellovibrio sp. NC01]